MFLECYHKIYKDLSVQGFLDYNSCAELENIIQYNVSEVLESNDIIYNDEIEYMCIYAHGSRVFGNPKNNSDIDFVLFYKGSIREDDLFNIFVDENIYIEHIKCDFNPIQIDDSSDIKYYIRKHDIEYHLKAILEKKINLAFALSDLEDGEELSSISKLKTGQIEDKSYTRELLDLKKEVVDLGLPSGTKWFKYNLGVDYKKLDDKPQKSIPEDWYGDYYAWGELEPNKTIEDGKIYFGWSNYKFGKNWNKLTKYCKYSSYGLNGFTDNLTLLLPEDDAAYWNTKLHNFKFHIPTEELWAELKKCTNNYWVNNYDPNKTIHNTENDGGIQGLNGRIFEGKNGNQLFIPAAGYYSSNIYHHASSHCYLWSSNFYLDSSSYAYCLYFSSNNIAIDIDGRYIGYSVRPAINL